MTGPLEGLRLLELVRWGPGAFCTMMLADMGAEVIKVETPPQAGRPGGTAVSPVRGETGDRSEQMRKLAHNNLNRNKRSIGIDLKSAEGRDLLLRLSATADILVEGFRPGVMKSLGCDYGTLSKENPRLIYVSLSGYGQDGPYSRLPGHDINYISIAGALSLFGEADRAPVVPLNMLADVASAAMHGVIGTLLALVAREKTGKGQYVDVSYMDGVVSMLAELPVISSYLAQGTVVKKGEMAYSGAYPYYAVYATKDDKYISVGCVEPHFWQRLCDLLGRPEMGKYHYEPEQLFQKPAGAQWQEIFRWLGDVFRTRTQEEWWSFLKDKDVCVSKVNDIAAALSDPQVVHRRMVEEFNHPQVGTVRQVGIPIKLSGTPGSIRSPAPFLGQDTDSVLTELGISSQDIRTLRERGVVY